MTRTSIRRAGAVAALTLTAIVTFTGCSALWINTQEGAQYGTYEQAKASGDGFRIPKLIPTDAVDLHIAYNTVKPGTVIAFDSADGITAKYCEPAPIHSEPAFEPGWWPKTTIPADGLQCGTWTTYNDHGTYLVWAD